MISYYVVGHSIIRRLRLEVERDCHGLYVGNSRVCYIGYGGSTVVTLWQRLAWMSLSRHSRVVMQVGSNDLATSSYSEEAAGSILELVNELLGRGVGEVVISQLLHRRSTYRMSAYRDFNHYNIAVDKVNDLLRQCCNESTLRYWKHDNSVQHHGTRHKQWTSLRLHSLLLVHITSKKTNRNLAAPVWTSRSQRRGIGCHPPRRPRRGAIQIVSTTYLPCASRRQHGTRWEEAAGHLTATRRSTFGQSVGCKKWHTAELRQEKHLLTKSATETHECDASLNDPPPVFFPLCVMWSEEWVTAITISVGPPTNNLSTEQAPQIWWRMNNQVKESSTMKRPSASNSQRLECLRQENQSTSLFKDLQSWRIHDS